ncbi:MAG: hypothetical protein IPP88_20625 [Betaproteobacteria bacterium]|nr:hypothetical protein [Betaproteobacteria bacterium]
MLVIPFSVSAETSAWIVGASMPYLQVRSDDNVRVTDSDILVGSSASDNDQIKTIRGAGDLATFATYKVPETDAGWLIDLTGRVKWPTASRAKGFSTGKIDYGAQINLARRVDRCTPHAKVAYQVRRGEIDDELRNGWAANAGVKYRLNGTSDIDFTYDYRQPSSAFGFKQSELSIAVGLKVSANWRVVLYGVKGLADGSPEWAVGASIEVRN